jgi:hypothetical protein
MVKATAGEDASKQATAPSRVAMEENFMAQRVSRCHVTIGFFGDSRSQSNATIDRCGMIVCRRIDTESFAAQLIGCQYQPKQKSPTRQKNQQDKSKTAALTNEPRAGPLKQRL